MHKQRSFVEVKINFLKEKKYQVPLDTFF